MRKIMHSIRSWWNGDVDMSYAQRRTYQELIDHLEAQNREYEANEYFAADTIAKQQIAIIILSIALFLTFIWALIP